MRFRKPHRVGFLQTKAPGIKYTRPSSFWVHLLLQAVLKEKAGQSVENVFFVSLNLRRVNSLVNIQLT